MPEVVHDPITEWFTALCELGEYIGIRFGRVSGENKEPEWIFLKHTEFDGIGGMGHILRQRGAELPRLPHIKYPSSPSWLWMARGMPKFMLPRRRISFGPLPQGPTPPDLAKPPPAVGWYVFSELATTQLKRVCRKSGVTINSFLLKHLTKAIRPDLEDEASVVPWMIPVNLRGKVTRERDTANFSSYVAVKVRSYETVRDVHREIYGALRRGEHWANWYAYKTGILFSRSFKKFLINHDYAMSQWNIGGFSNLGDWDPEKNITQADCEGPWLFCPPVLRCQLVGAGCMTFQNQLSLVIQVHPELTTNPAVPRLWINNWVKEIEVDVASVLSEPALAERCC